MSIDDEGTAKEDAVDINSSSQVSSAERAENPQIVESCSATISFEKLIDDGEPGAQHDIPTDRAKHPSVASRYWF